MVRTEVRGVPSRGPEAGQVRRWSQTRNPGSPTRIFFQWDHRFLPTGSTAVEMSVSPVLTSVGPPRTPVFRGTRPTTSSGSGGAVEGGWPEASKGNRAREKKGGVRV